MELEKGEIALIDRDVMKAIRENSVLSEKIEDSQEQELTLGQKILVCKSLFKKKTPEKIPRSLVV